MTFVLQGPFPAELATLGTAARAALSRAESWLRQRPDTRGSLEELASAAADPGLYLLWTTEPKPALAGFWLVLGNAWLDHGPAGPPDRSPPYVKELLEALTEGVWWNSLTCWPMRGARWSPLIVLEWIPPLSARANVPPPGVAPPERARNHAEERGSWLFEEAPKSGTAAQHATFGDAAGQRADLPALRSLVTVVRGRLEKRSRSHVATFEMVDPSALGQAAALAGLDEWITQAIEAPTLGKGDAPFLAEPVAGPGGRALFPLSGWLTRSLEIWPLRPSELRVGVLQERDVGGRWLAQAKEAGSVTMSVIIGAAVLAITVYLAARPQERDAPPPSTLDPQPSLSVCSSDHQAFVDELRCQVAHFAQGGDPSARVCRDEGSEVPAAGVEEGARTRRLVDQRPQWCGLRDRMIDGNIAADDESPWADLAASRACFNVLGHPYNYERPSELPGERTGRPIPQLLLEPSPLQIEPLRAVVDALDAACDELRPQWERRVEGAILATHIGVPAAAEIAADRQPRESARLRLMAASVAMEGLRPKEERCFRTGMDEGVGLLTTYEGLCGSGLPATVATSSHAWRALGAAEGEPSAQAIKAYHETRYPRADLAATDLWTCHDKLSEYAAPSSSAPALWGLSVPIPERYDPNGAGVNSQIELDASMRALRNGTGGGPCWSVLGRLLQRYEPVHPLLQPEDALAWPSPEQQLCAQVCAVHYEVRSSPLANRWVSPKEDLSRCVTDSAPLAELAYDRAQIDRLGLPWNGTERLGWQLPEADAICAFNLVAQGYMTQGEHSVLLDALAPFGWAGETEVGSGIAGGEEGHAARSAQNLDSYGRSRSRTSCGYVASQCFVTGLLGVMGKPGAEPYQWRAGWSTWYGELVRARPQDLESSSPWCGLVHPFLPRSGALPEGQLEYPCAKGVDDTRMAVEQVLAGLTHAAATAEEAQ